MCSFCTHKCSVNNFYFTNMFQPLRLEYAKLLCSMPAFLNPNCSATRIFDIFFSTTHNWSIFVNSRYSKQQKINSTTRLKTSTTRYRVETRRLRNADLYHTMSILRIMQLQMFTLKVAVILMQPLLNFHNLVYVKIVTLRNL